MIAYRATLDVPRELALFTAGLLRAEHRLRGTPRGSRALTCFWQAVPGLRWFRDRTTCEALARDHGISRATAYRYPDEVIEVLVAQAPQLLDALAEGLPYVIPGGTVIASDSCSERKPGAGEDAPDLWYCGKTHGHGANVQAVMTPGGLPLRVSQAEPGSVHDLTAARRHALPALYPAAATGLPALADAGYDGTGILMPRRRRSNTTVLDINARTRNALLRSLRAEGERGFALLKTRWRTLRHITASPSKSATSRKPLSS